MWPLKEALYRGVEERIAGNGHSDNVVPNEPYCIVVQGSELGLHLKHK